MFGLNISEFCCRGLDKDTLSRDYGSGRRSDETCLRTLLRNLTSQERKELQDKSDVYGSSFIHWVSRWGCPETVGSVLSVRKGDAKLRDKQGITPLHVAALGGHTLCVQQLIDNGADVRALTYQTHHTPLHYACIGGSVEAVSMLLSNGAESTSVCLPYKRTCLHIACIQGHTEVVVRLIQENATELELNYITVESTDTMDSIENSSTTGSANYIDCIDKFGLTPLALAMAKGHSQTAFKLLSLGADINCGIAGVVHDEGFEPLQHSQEAVNGITLWHCASAMSDISVLQNITQQSEEYDGSEAAGEWVTKCDGQLRAPLHYAVVYEREETVEKLLSLGAEIASLDTYGMSALHYAVQKGNDIVSI
ncbi:hypothetical protein SARC_02544 [Sphaeroforma arctica JP610]|uniref:Uncharacterized protein n=1 Tax=Sphaeroforma arctica JP610 TaxID=667725 RepID=A0A0L0GAH2_9EUKA|nr:hypothetical protein SARC_02544 [Sphaeroforma arctica JP610]KNC85248.1 hypothetical protein SARC_02544 [Sphaeroforma arctica JP610]|eukprot:XP_014159150.1 hypothetical protein SARC_02544 [Sphaeroforma arctica JP610]